MANFNLLPWRDAEREAKKKQFFTLLGFVALLAAGTAFGGHLYMLDRIAYQESRNTYLNQEIKRLDAKIKEIEALDETRQALIDRIRVIEQLQSTRPSIVHLFDEMAKALPPGMFISSMKQKGTLVAVEGKTESDARVSSFMNQLGSSPWMKSSNLKIITVDKKNRNRFESQTQSQLNLKEFRLQVTQLQKTMKKDDDKNNKPQKKTPQGAR